MIQEIDCDLLEAPVEAIIHFANCQCTMGTGLALRIKQEYPEAYDADLKTKIGDAKKLGSFSFASAKDGKIIFNAYTQFNYGRLARYTSYDAVCNSLTKIEHHMCDARGKTLGIPKNAGCRLGGGDWRIVRAIIESVFAESPIELYICNYEKG